MPALPGAELDEMGRWGLDTSPSGLDGAHPLVSAAALAGIAVFVAEGLVAQLRRRAFGSTFRRVTP